MGLLELLILAVGLSMDAFAVSICKGLSVGRVRPVHMLTAGLWFGGFQALMPFLGWLLGSQFEALITNIDHWIAFILLGFLGGKMIYESFGEEETTISSFSTKTLLTLGVATSIDALAVGVSMAFLKTSIYFPAFIIGFVTFALSLIGVISGYRFGKIKGINVELFGGIIFIAIGVKILIEHLME